MKLACASLILLSHSLIAADPALTRQQWIATRDATLNAMQTVMGPLPGEAKRCPLDLKIESETDCGSYTRQLISYQSEPGSRVPAYLCQPKSATVAQPAPAVLCLHPTDNVIGHKVVVGLGGKAHRQYAAELAERGFVTLAPSYPQLAQYQPDLAALGYASGTMKAIHDNRRGLDLLATLPNVASGKGFGVIGHSLGGHNALFTAAFDDRLKVIVTSCGFDSFTDYKGGDLTAWTQQRYMPRLTKYLGHPKDVPFDFDGILIALAARSVFVNAPLHDANFIATSVDRLATTARPTFTLMGGSLTVLHPDSEHDFPDAAREAAYQAIAQRLR